MLHLYLKLRCGLNDVHFPVQWRTLEGGLGRLEGALMWVRPTCPFRVTVALLNFEVPPIQNRDFAHDDRVGSNNPASLSHGLPLLNAPNAKFSIRDRNEKVRVMFSKK